MMNLSDIIKDINENTKDSYVCAKRPWTKCSEAILYEIDESYKIPESIKEQGFEYFLETYIIFDFKNDFKDKSFPEFLDMILFYAENDAFPF